MQKISASELAGMDRERLWALPDQPLKIIFQDGEIVADQRQAILTAYMCGLQQRLPKIPLLTRHFVGERRMTSDLHLKMINQVRWDAFDAYGSALDNEQLSKICLELVNEYYNDYTERLGAYATTMSILDILDVMAHPDIHEVNDKAGVADKSIVQAHRTIEKVLYDPEALPTNILAASVRSGTVKVGQVLQCVGPRGSVTDIDSNIFSYPADSGFAGGLYRFYESLIESRTAAKSLTFTEKPLQETEYFNRRLQLLAASIRDIYDGDCGSKEYLSWQVAAGDLAMLAGQRYLKADGTLGTVWDNDVCRHELVGKTVKLRNVLHCRTPDSGFVCSTCYGELERSIPYQTNIGHVAATALCKPVSQRVLSVKHLDHSASSQGLRLSEFEQRYVRLGSDPNQIFLAQRLEGREVKLFLRPEEVERLSEVKTAESVEVLLPTHISSLHQVGFRLYRDGKATPEGDLVQISNGSRTSSLSKEMLVYLREHSWSLTPNGEIEISLKNWDVDLPLFTTPRRQENMLDYMKTIESFLKAIRKGGPTKSLKDYPTVDSALRGFSELVGSQLFVNIVHQSILVKSCQIRSSWHRDHRVPLQGNALEFGKFNSNIFNRSQGAAMAFQNHKQQWNSPETYLVKHRPVHPLDAILLPKPSK